MTGPLSTDVLVVGAGPAGTNTARLLAREGFRTLLLEEDAVVGEPMQCAGLVTERLFEHVPFRPSAVALNWVRGATIHAPSGFRFDVDAGRDHAVVMDRPGFDRRLAEEARKAGAEIWTRARYVAAERRNGGLAVDVERQDEDGRVESLEVTTRLLVGADGVQTNVGRDFGLPRPKEFLAGYEAELDGLVLEDPKVIPIFTDQRLAPDFFSWIIPVSKTVGRAGLCMRMRRTSARKKFEEFLEHPQVKPYCRSPRMVKPIVGSIPLGMPRRFAADHLMLVGDACAMPKPTSGGGIWTAIVASTFAAEAAIPALRRGDLSYSSLSRYERRFLRSRVGREIRMGWRIRRAFAGMTNAEIERALRLMAGRRAVGVIDTFGDIDHPSRLVAPLLLAEPRLWGLVPKALRRALFSA